MATALPTWDAIRLQEIPFMRPYWLAVCERSAVVNAPLTVISNGDPIHAVSIDPYGAIPSITVLQRVIDSLIGQYVNSSDYPSGFDGADSVVMYTTSRFYELATAGASTAGFTRKYIPWGATAAFTYSPHKTISVKSVTGTPILGRKVRKATATFGGTWGVMPTAIWQPETQDVKLTNPGAATANPSANVAITAEPTTWYSAALIVMGDDKYGYKMDRFAMQKKTPTDLNSDCEITINGDWHLSEGGHPPSFDVVNGVVVLGDAGWSPVNPVADLITVVEPATPVRAKLTLTDGDYRLDSITGVTIPAGVSYGASTSITVDGKWNTQPVIAWNGGIPVVTNPGTSYDDPAPGRVSIVDPAIKTAYGFFQAGDILDKHIFTELRTAIGLLKWTMIAAPWGAMTSLKWGDGGQDFGSDTWDVYKPIAESSWADSSWGCSLLLCSSRYWWNPGYPWYGGHASLLRSQGKISFVSPNLGMNAGVDMYAMPVAPRDWEIWSNTVEEHVPPYHSPFQSTFNANGDLIGTENKLNLFYTNTRSMDGSPVESSVIGGTDKPAWGTPPAFPPDSEHNVNYVHGYELTAPVVVLRFDVAGGFNWTA